MLLAIANYLGHLVAHPSMRLYVEQEINQAAMANLNSYGNAMHAVRTQCEVLDVGKYPNPSFGPFSQVFGSVPGFLWLPKHLGCGIFELSTISP